MNLAPVIKFDLKQPCFRKKLKFLKSEFISFLKSPTFLLDSHESLLSSLSCVQDSSFLKIEINYSTAVRITQILNHFQTNLCSY